MSKDGPMSLTVALNFAEYPRLRGALCAPADTTEELYEALAVLSAVVRSNTPAAQPELPEPVAIIGPIWLLAWTGGGPIEPLVKSHGLKIGDGLYTAYQMHAYAAACHQMVDDAMITQA